MVGCIIAQAVVLFMAIWMTCAFIGQLVVMLGMAINKRDYKIPAGNLIICSALWSIFFICEKLITYHFI